MNAKTIETYAFLSLVLFYSGQVFAQTTEEAWDTYMAAYEGGMPGSVTLRMDLIDSAPLQNLSGLLITGLTYKSSREDGFPETETFPLLYQVADELIAIIQQEYQGLTVGSFMHNHQRLEYFYVNNTDGLKQRIKEFYLLNYPKNQYYIAIKEDPEWEYYREFLYPNAETQNYMADQSIIRKLQEAGDDLQYQRRVDHWIYFATKKQMHEFQTEVEKIHFQIESSQKSKHLALPHELRIWKVSHVDMASIHPITSNLRKLAKKYGGEYDGWETAVVK